MFERSITSLTGRSSAASVRSRRLGASVRDAVLGVDPSNEMLRRGVAKALRGPRPGPRGAERSLLDHVVSGGWSSSALLFLFISEWRMEFSKKMWRLPGV